VPPSSEPPVETEPQICQIRNGSECPSLTTRKRLRTPCGHSLPESGQEAGRANARGNANVSSSKKAAGDREEEDSTPSLLTSSVVPISSATAREVIQEEATRQVRNGSECPSPETRKRLRTRRSGHSLRERGQEAGRTNRRGNATNASGSSSKKAAVGDREEEDPTPSLVTSSAASICSDTAQEVVQEEATPVAYLPPGWTIQKVEPDW
jgi:hypothetical protein